MVQKYNGDKRKRVEKLTNDLGSGKSLWIFFPMMILKTCR